MNFMEPCRTAAIAAMLSQCTTVCIKNLCFDILYSKKLNEEEKRKNYSYIYIEIMFLG
jgi:hypothetical protein